MPFEVRQGASLLQDSSDAGAGVGIDAGTGVGIGAGLGADTGVGSEPGMR